MKRRKIWYSGNKLQLLEGDDFFNQIESDINQAKFEILFQTYIFSPDITGKRVSDALKAAAARGVAVHLVVDGFGSITLPQSWLNELKAAGVRTAVFKPIPHLWRLKVQYLHRLHRKIIVIDRNTAFVGGINVSDDQLEADSCNGYCRLDFAAKVEGPVVDQIYQRAHRFHSRLEHRWQEYLKGIEIKNSPDPKKSAVVENPGSAEVAFVVRDNFGNRLKIEKQYRRALAHAKSDVLIANAYFFPGYRLMVRLRRAAERGVRVRLVLQGKTEFLLLKFASEKLYENLLQAGVEIFEYKPRLLHAKVAVIDSEWATIGSFNLDPFSLLSNLESNLFIKDKIFSEQLRKRLEEVIEKDCRKLNIITVSIFRKFAQFFAFWLMQILPAVLNYSRIRHKPFQERRRS